MGFLNVLEVSKKQYYIFKSNRLKENIGASEIIAFVTEKLPQELCTKNNGIPINSGGGSSIFYFENNKDSENFSKEYSLYLLKNFPSLEFFIAKNEYDPDKDSIIGKTSELYGKLENKKGKREQYSYISDFGICEKCSSTRLPAVKKDDFKKRYYSSEVKSKIEMYDKNQEYIKQFAVNLTDLGTSKNEKSYIAITHIDGNRMGKKIKILRDKYKDQYTSENAKKINEQYINELKQFSEEIKKAFENAFNKVVETVRSRSDYLRKAGLDLKENVLPIRKIVLAGDDVCYMTDARIALECAYIFMSELEKYKIIGEKITACAGIAMVKEKYPFFKTYELSEELCKNAKSSIEEDVCESRIDWHIVQGEYNNNLKEIRDTDYKTYDGKNLSLRPLVISKDTSGENHYLLFKKDIVKFGAGNIARSKIKGMLKEMKKGEKQLDTYIEINQLFKALGTYRIGSKTGFVSGKCVLFDSIETMDYFIPLCTEEE